MQKRGTVWIAAHSEPMHEALCLPHVFSPKTWTALVFQDYEGALGFRFAAADIAHAVARAIVPAVAVRPSNYGIHLRTESGKIGHLFGDLIWISVESETTAVLLAQELERCRSDEKKRQVYARYGKVFNSSQVMPACRIVDVYPQVIWPLDLAVVGSGAECRGIWYGFASSLGDFGVVVGMDDRKLADCLHKAHLPEDVDVRTVHRAADLPVW